MNPAPPAAVEDEVRERFASAGVRGVLHARRLDPDRDEVAVDADRPVVMASVYKLPVLAAFGRAVDAGALDPTAPVTLDPDERTPGATGIAAMADPVTASWRDLARSMIAVSDNAAGDALLDAVGLDAVRRTLGGLGLTATRIEGGTRDVYRILTDDTGAGDAASAMDLLRDNDHLTHSRAFDPFLASSTTARDMTALLAAVWADEAASPEQCAFMRTVLHQQIWPHRLSSGFPYDGVRVAGKTGTLGPLRHEVGVVHHRHETPIAVAVLTEAARADPNQPRVDAAIGAVAALAVATLR
ncbi:serine hydrolase [Iamia sp. SCSIO 61187]|uniref:serine hydrolase n=1 Tax=Iamia sp. SCSIO 61187 TaxID=2722752 RepID=UPI001C635D39|nr:serine hydrolase [Iamia sp. SCSIO 61187]QYG95175.1 serine hydrolase [Iamia sp. SCSIO 61187]